MEFPNRFEKQLQFIVEIDKLKTIIRRSLLVDESRLENDAEHSWHIALSALTLVEYANNPMLDIFKCIKMLLIHDLVEINAGDTFAYNEKGNEDKYDREKKAADIIYSYLPEDQKSEYQSLWFEFEVNETDEAQFAHAIDSFLPILHNFKTKGKQWKKLGVTKEKVLKRNIFIKKGSEKIWKYIEKIVEESEKKGYLA